jgi:hypothetical protein
MRLARLGVALEDLGALAGVADHADRAPDPDRGRLEVEVAPPERQCLAAARAGESEDVPQGEVVAVPSRPAEERAATRPQGQAGASADPAVSRDDAAYPVSWRLTDPRRPLRGRQATDCTGDPSSKPDCRTLYLRCEHGSWHGVRGAQL